jgi:hypothetical protein
MSVYPNQTNAAPGTSFFAPIGSGGGGGSASNWYQYPALSTITYSGAGGIANFTEVYAEIGMSTPQIYASTLVGDFVIGVTGIGAPEIQVDSLFVSSINNEVYPPSAPIFGVHPFTEGDTSATITAIGITPESVVLITPFGSDTSNPIVGISPSSNAFLVTLSSPATSNYYLNWVAFTGPK